MPLPLVGPLLLAAASASAGTAAVDPFLLQYAETRGFQAGRPTAVQLTPDGRAALFLRSGPRSRVQALFETDLATGETRERVAPEGPGELRPEERAQLERARITARGVVRYELSRDGRRVAFVLGGRLRLLDRATGAVREVPGAERALDPRFSPDGGALAWVKDRDLWVHDLASGRARRLTRARGPAVTNGLAEFVAQEEMDRDEGYWWSPDGRALAYAEVDESAVERRTLCDAAAPEKGCSEVRYPRAGRANATVRLHVVPAAGGPAVRIRWDADRFPYLAAVRWQRGAPLALVVQSRSQQHEQVLAADPRTGATRVLLEERDDAWIDLWEEMPRFLPDGRFYWVTERGGAPEVELRAADGARLETVVPAATGYVGYGGLHGDELVFVGAPDPTREEVYRVSPGGAPRRVPLPDDVPGSRQVVLARGGDGTLAVAHASLRRLPRTTVLAPDGARRLELPSVAEEPPFVPTTELRVLGEAGLRAALVRPRALGPGATLPVVVSVYGGPLPARVMGQASHRPMIAEQWLADQGFLVALFDGRGTGRRGRAFERAIRGDFSEIPLGDQIAGLRALAAETPGLDLGRVGITGWSFGGWLSALAVLARPDVFHAAAAGAPVTDWREYDTHYTERYLGLPEENPDGYARSSLLPRAPALSRPLLLLHGTADDNVWFSHSLALADALFRAGKAFELVPIAGATHMVPEPAAAARRWERIARFFQERLGAERPGPAPSAPPSAGEAATPR